MKIIKRFLMFIVVVVVVLGSFSGCSAKTKLKRVSKNLTGYSIEAVFCDEEKKLTAVEVVDFINDKDTILNSVCFNVYGKAFSETAKIKPYSKQKMVDCFPNGINYGDVIISNVLVDNKNANYGFVGEDFGALEVQLLEPLYTGERVQIIIEFVLYLANCTHRLGYNDNSVNLGNWYPVVAVFENGGFIVDPYYANGDPFYSECANYEVEIYYPEKYIIATSGEEISRVVEDGVVSSIFKANAVRDFAMCLATDYEIKTVEVEDITVSVYAYAGDGNIGMYLETAVNTISLFNEMYGNYPYPVLNVAFTDFFQGGMEYPGLVYISDKVQDIVEIKKVIVHEIAHEWWYGVVGNNEVKDAWFDEGLAEYSTLLYFENYPEEGVDVEKYIKDTIINYELYLDVVKSLNIKVNYAMDLAVNEYSTEYEYVYMIYVKGMLFFDSLRNSVGDDDFFQLLKNIYKHYSFKVINKEIFIAQLEDVSGKDMSEFVEGWLSGKVDIVQN